MTRRNECTLGVRRDPAKELLRYGTRLDGIVKNRRNAKADWRGTKKVQSTQDANVGT